MANVYIVRAEDVRLVSDGEGGWIAVPDIKLPPESWTAYAVRGQPAFHLLLEHNGKKATSTWHGPHVLGGQKLYIVDIDDDSDKTILAALQDRLGGAANCTPLVRALRARPALRSWIKQQPWFSPIRNSAGNIVGVRAPLVIAGRNGFDLDGDEIEDADEMTDLEG